MFFFQKDSLETKSQLPRKKQKQKETKSEPTLSHSWSLITITIGEIEQLLCSCDRPVWVGIEQSFCCCERRRLWVRGIKVSAGSFAWFNLVINRQVQGCEVQAVKKKKKFEHYSYLLAWIINLQTAISLSYRKKETNSGPRGKETHCSKPVVHVSSPPP